MNKNELHQQPAEPRPRDRAETAASLSLAAETSGRALRHFSIMAVLLIVAGALFGLLPRWHRAGELRAETAGLGVQSVTVIRPMPGKAGPALTLPAEIKPLVESPIYARASGYLKRWLVDIGAQVKGGDLLAEIDTPELNQEMEQARAQLGQATAALALARTTAERWSELVKTASVSEQEAAEKTADLALKSAAVEAASANLHRLEDLQGFQKVTAPFEGTITARLVDVGQLINTSSNRELFRLAQTSKLRVYARVPQSAAGGVTTGQLAQVTIPELPANTFTARVVRTSGALSADSRTLLTELEVDNPHGEILAGSFAQVKLTGLKSNPPLTIPGNALLFRPEGPQVALVTVGDQVELRSVTLGRDLGTTIEILQGVSASDRVILNPPDSLASGLTVRVTEAPAGTNAAPSRTESAPRK